MYLTLMNERSCFQNCTFPKLLFLWFKGLYGSNMECTLQFAITLMYNFIAYSGRKFNDWEIDVSGALSFVSVRAYATTIMNVRWVKKTHNGISLQCKFISILQWAATFFSHAFRVRIYVCIWSRCLYSAYVWILIAMSLIVHIIIMEIVQAEKRLATF